MAFVTCNESPVLNCTHISHLLQLEGFGQNNLNVQNGAHPARRSHAVPAGRKRARAFTISPITLSARVEPWPRRALVPTGKRKISAPCLLPNPDSPLLVKREDMRRCAFLKPKATHMDLRRGKQRSSESGTELTPTRGMSPSFLSFVRLKFGKI